MVSGLYILVVFLTIASTLASIVELDATKFREEVVQDSRTWMVEFYSAMCGSCQEFSPTWKKIAQKAKSVMKGQINIDTPSGMQLADQLGALQEGIPNVRIFSKAHDEKGVSIVNGTVSFHLIVINCGIYMMFAVFQVRRR